MPDQQPAATENTPVAPNDADTPVTAMTGSDGDHGPGGGGLGPRTGAVPAGATGAPLGTAPNAVMDVPTPQDTGGEPEGIGGDRRVETEASQAIASDARSAAS